MIQFKNFTAAFGEKQVVSNLNLSLKANTITAIIGASGSGKTTLLRTLCRMNDRISNFFIDGNVLIDGKDIYQSETDVYALRRKVGMVFQKPCVFPESIFENVVFGVKDKWGRNELPGLAQKLLRDVSLWDEVKDRLEEKATTLSQGQQQRLTLARTLAVGPQVLLMDEPTSSLDPKSTEVIEMLAQSLKANHTILWVTHQQAQAHSIADQVLVIKDNQVSPSLMTRQQEDPVSFTRILQNIPGHSE